MIPVEQQILAVFDEHGDCIVHGDCLRAALASLFELPIEEVPHFAESERWWGDWMDWLAERNLRIGTAFYTVSEDDPTKLNGWPGDIYWLACVLSPRIKARCHTCGGHGVANAEGAYCEPCNGSGRVPGTHMVVMYGNEIAWDPHPQRTDGHLGFTHGYDLRVIDPARLALRAA